MNHTCGGRCTPQGGQCPGQPIEGAQMGDGRLHLVRLLDGREEESACGRHQEKGSQGQDSLCWIH
eukprot:COSAG01_NODE_38_length_33931_cov_75.163632_23_plen_65_part_00